VATHDYVIANGTGAAVRSDLNDALAAIVSQNSSASEPATMYAYMLWADTTAGIMKMRNGANSAWISLWELDGTFIATDISLSAGTAGAPSLYFTGDTNTGIYSPGADQVAISTAGSGRLFVDASGNIGINTTPSSLGTSVTTLEVKGGSTTRSGGLRVSSSDSSVKGAFYIYDGAGVLGTESATPLDLYTGNSPRLSITSAGLVGIGTTPTRQLHVNSTAIFDTNGDGTGTNPSIAIGSNSVGLSYVGGAQLSFTTGSAEKARLTSDGKFLVGTSSSPSTGQGDVSIFVIQGYRGNPTNLGLFSTTADGASSPTERMRIHNTGAVLIAKTAYADLGTAGVQIWGSNEPGATFITRDSGTPVSINRLTNDGNLIEFYQATTLEGTISVSGTTVSYNGA
jgi:hypothetical protein